MPPIRLASPKAPTVDAVIFNGGYGIDYVEFAASLMQKNHPSVTVKLSPSTQIAQELQPRFLGGNPPDLIDNSGAQAIGFSAIIDQLEDMNSVLDARASKASRSATPWWVASKSRAPSATSSSRSTT